MRAIIVSDAPKLVDSWTPDEKVEVYLNRADVLLVLATADNQIEGGIWITRQNIIDEIARARGKVHLGDHICVLKERRVTLPSNINPVYDNLDPDDLQPAMRRFLAQLAAWNYTVPASLDVLVEPKREPANRDLVAGLRPEDPMPTHERVRRLLDEFTKPEQRAYVAQIVALLRESEEWEERAVAGHVLEAIGAIDAALLSSDLLDELARHPDFSIRSSAAVMLYELAVSSPGSVPIDLIGRLAWPSKEDWYVYTPALNALKQLALSRPEAMERFRWIAASSNREDREDAAVALRDIAAVRPQVIPRKLLEQLKRDPDRIVRRLAEQVQQTVGNVELQEEQGDYYLFGPF